MPQGNLNIKPPSVTLGPGEKATFRIEEGHWVWGGTMDPNLGSLDAANGMGRFDAIYTAPSNIQNQTTVWIRITNNPTVSPENYGYAEITLTPSGGGGPQNPPAHGDHPTQPPTGPTGWLLHGQPYTGVVHHDAHGVAITASGEPLQPATGTPPTHGDHPASGAKTYTFSGPAGTVVVTIDKP